MAPLLSWSPTTFGSTDPIVVTNGKGFRRTLSQITYPGGEFGGSYAKAIQAAIEDLSNGVYPYTAAYRFDTRATIPDTEPMFCPEDAGHPYAPCGRYDASDYELNYTSVPDIEVDNLNKDPWPQSWSGTVWVHRPVELDQAIIARKNCTVDFLHNLVSLKDDVPFISMGQGTDMCEFACIRNARVLPYYLQTQAILRLNVLPGFNAKLGLDRIGHAPFGNLQYNTLENITIEGDSDVDRCFDGIHIYNASGPAEDGTMWGGNFSQWNTFRNIRMSGVRRAIFIEQATWNANYNNTNIFSNIITYGFRRLVEFKVPVVCELTKEELKLFYDDPDEDFLGIQACHFNVFQHVIGSGAKEGITDGGFVNIYGNGNRLEHVALRGWSADYGKEYSAVPRKKAGKEESLSASYLCAYTLASFDSTNLDISAFRIDAPSPDEYPAPRNFTQDCTETNGGQLRDDYNKEHLCEHP